MSLSSRAGVNQRRGFLPKDLKKMLESYGALCRFRAAMRPEVQKLTDDNTQASFKSNINICKSFYLFFFCFEK